MTYVRPIPEFMNKILQLAKSADEQQRSFDSCFDEHSFVEDCGSYFKVRNFRNVVLGNPLTSIDVYGYFSKSKLKDSQCALAYGRLAEQKEGK